MIRKLLVGTGVLGAVLAAAVVYDAGHLSSYVKSMNSAEGLDVTYSINQVGGTQTKYHVVLAKPNKALIETPSKTYVADGENVTVYDRTRNTYYVKEQTADFSREMFADESVSLWRPFFDAKAFDKVAKTKNEGSRTRRGEKLNTVSALVDASGEYSVRLHLSQKDNLVRQAEFTEAVAGAPSTRVLNVESITTTVVGDDMFVFNVPSDARELTEADLMAEWQSNYGEALETAKALGKGVIIDFYADW